MSHQMGNDQDFWEEVQFDSLKAFGWIAFAGLLLIGVALLVGKEGMGSGLAVLGALCVVPGAFHGVLVTIWHWKSRYKGSHSKLWGALLILETTGWSRVIYFFRHVLPDRRNRGRYARLETPRG
jgi:hypothetical protein